MGLEGRENMSEGTGLQGHKDGSDLALARENNWAELKGRSQLTAQVPGHRPGLDQVEEMASR